MSPHSKESRLKATNHQKVSHESVGAVPLYVVVREDLTPGLQIAQSAHAVADFAKFMPDDFHSWREDSGYIVVLGCDGILEVQALASEAHSVGISFVKFEEPDFGHEVTALAFPPSPGTKQFLAHLKTAGKRSDSTTERSQG